VRSATGIGNAYMDLRLSLLNPAVNFTSLLTAAAPTGDKAAGFSTGHVTYDPKNGISPHCLSNEVAHTVEDERRKSIS